MRVTDNVYHLSGVRGANSYLFDSPEGLVLVDTGFPGNADAILGELQSLGKAPEDVRHILLTHCDIDHVGSAEELRSRTGATIGAHADEVALLTGQAKRVSHGLFGLITGILRMFIRVRPIQPDLRFREGDEICGLRVLHTPGHTPGSMSLFLAEKGVLFSGDALLTDRDGNVTAPRTAMAGDPEKLDESAERLRALPFTTLLPGHGRPATGLGE
jgi:glyoxylase-like metal-dependent hydrolase (beta-lactamase superfamily II)